MKFIKTKSIYNNATITINAEQIAYMYRTTTTIYSDEVVTADCTRVFLVGGGDVEVKETVELIKTMITRLEELNA